MGTNTINTIDMKNTKKLIKKCGGYKNISLVLNENLETVYKWGQRGIPSSQWYRFMIAFDLQIHDLHRAKTSDIKSK